MQYCPQCKGEGGAFAELADGKIKEFICRLCKGEKFVTDEVHDRYMSENPKKIYFPDDGEKRKLAEKFARENIKKSIEYGIKSDVRSLGKKI